MSSIFDRDAALRTATEAAKISGAILMHEHKEAFESGQGLSSVQTKESEIDFVTHVDGLAQQAIIETIQKHYPDHRFIAEEKGAEELGDASSDYAWIIDPLDGTLNFIHGKPNFGTIIALREKDEVIVGVMWLPLKNDLFTCIKGKGVFWNNKPVKLRTTQGMTDAVFCSNLSHRAKTMEDGTRYVTLPYCASVENYGCAADELGQVLMGRNDGAFFNGPKLWDLAAGCMMIEEAGGKSKYELLDPDDERSGLLCAVSTKPIFNELCDFVFKQRKA